MSQPATTQNGLPAWSATMLELRVTICGFPEEVQRMADAIEVALEGMIEWQCCATANSSRFIEITGCLEYETGMCPLSDIAALVSFNKIYRAEASSGFHLANLPLLHYSVSDSYSFPFIEGVQHALS